MGIVDYANVQRLKAGLLTPDERTVRDAWSKMPAHYRRLSQAYDALANLKSAGKIDAERYAYIDGKLTEASVKLGAVSRVGIECMARAREAGYLDGMEGLGGEPWDWKPKDVIAISAIGAAVILAFVFGGWTIAVLAGFAVAALALIDEAIELLVSSNQGPRTDGAGNVIRPPTVGETVETATGGLVMLGLLALAGYALSKKAKG